MIKYYGMEDFTVLDHVIDCDLLGGRVGARNFWG